MRAWQQFINKHELNDRKKFIWWLVSLEKAELAFIIDMHMTREDLYKTYMLEKYGLEQAEDGTT